MAARMMRATVVPSISQWLEKRVAVCMSKPGKNHADVVIVNRMKSWLKYSMMAHIGLSIVLDSLGRNGTLKKRTFNVQMDIGKCIEHQAFLEYMSVVDPSYFKRLKGWYLDDPNRTYDRKITAMRLAHNKHETMEWKDLTDEQQVRLGAFVLQGVMSLKEQSNRYYIFETIKDWNSDKRGKKKHRVNYLGLSKHGFIWRATLQKMIDDEAFNAWPMLCPPREWTNETPGGYLTCPAKKYRSLVHNGKGTVLGQTHLDVLNTLQRVPHRVNRYIYDLQRSLIGRYWEIGSFITYEKDTYEEENMPIRDSEYIASLDKKSPEYKKLMRVFTDAYDKQKLKEKQAGCPRRTLAVAERFVDEEQFWLTWFVDWRGRMYAQCDTLNVQGADYQKALIHAAYGDEVTDDNRDEVYHNLCINLAINAEWQTPDGKSNKLPYDDRVRVAHEWLQKQDIAAIVEDPLSHPEWMKFEEPWQGLATIEEIYALFYANSRTRTRLYCARDMTCSGVQIMAALIRDLKAGIATNLMAMPDGKMRDAYDAVAVEARTLLTDDTWMSEKFAKREENRVNRNKKNPGNEWQSRGNIFDFDINLVDRKICKLATMIAGYGGTFLSRSEGVYEALKEAEIETHVADRAILAKAVIEGMDIAFPKIKELNDWWVQVIGCAVEKLPDGEHSLTWVTPQGGTTVHQQYRENLTDMVHTHAASGGHYARISTDAMGTATLTYGYGETLARKHQTGGPANMVHSLDADILVGAVNNIPKEWPQYYIHDCALATAVHIEDVVRELRHSFYRTCSYDFLQHIVDRWDVADMGIPEKGELDLTECINAPYMFT